MSAVGEPSVTFDRGLVELFAEASNDRNPLHTRGEYARATAYGEPVVFGVLAALALLGRMRGVVTEPVRRLTASFRQPVFVGVEYEVVVTGTGDHRRGELRRAGQRVVTVAVRGGDPADPTDPVAGEPAPPTPMRAEPARWTVEDLLPGTTVDGGYRTTRFAELVTRLGLGDGPLPAAHLAALLWSSYLVGMEVPGRQALFTRVTMDFHDERMTGTCSYRAEVRRVDPRFRLVELTGRVLFGRRTVASAMIQALVRPPLTPVALAGPPREVDALPTLEGRVAVVVGASRGLGAAVALVLARRGCTVVGCYRDCETEAARLERAAPGGLLRLERGDAADPEFCARLAGEVATRHGRVDLLVCSAAPALRPLRLLAGAAGELADHVADTVRLVATPVAAFLPLLDRAEGQVVAVSSRALSAPPAQWPHYVAAKGAVEHLVHALAPANPRLRFLICRPRRMDTAYVDSVTDDHPAAAPLVVATELVDAIGRFADRPVRGRVPVLEV